MEAICFHFNLHISSGHKKVVKILNSKKCELFSFIFNFPQHVSSESLLQGFHDLLFLTKGDTGP